MLTTTIIIINKGKKRDTRTKNPRGLILLCYVGLFYLSPWKSHEKQLYEVVHTCCLCIILIITELTVILCFFRLLLALG